MKNMFANLVQPVRTMLDDMSEEDDEEKYKNSTADCECDGNSA